jgi:actin-related protein 4
MSLPEASSTIPTPSYQQAPSLPVMIINAVNGVDPEILPHMLSNVVVVGGTSLTPGLVDRLTAEIQALAQGVRSIFSFFPFNARLAFSLIFFHVVR